MKLAVHCSCAVARTIDTDKVGPYRLRCTTCREIIYDPNQQAVAVEPESDSQFQTWLEGSAELKVLASSDGEGSPKLCPKHPERRVVAACNGCSALLCRACLDRVGDKFTCSACVDKTLGLKEKRADGGIGGFFTKLFGASPAPKKKGRRR
jgi:hypothetical protein